ncbi:hypothetical protein BRD56_02785 [Thermoplasmatales archaeon SW_10_69_26]|nr:MAG: hypothetical protein BRD56_02785 [Thermoplasmatales archaeon SW_10_69_26]
MLANTTGAFTLQGSQAQVSLEPVKATPNPGEEDEPSAETEPSTQAEPSRASGDPNGSTDGGDEQRTAPAPSPLGALAVAGAIASWQAVSRRP